MRRPPIAPPPDVEPTSSPHGTEFRPSESESESESDRRGLRAVAALPEDLFFSALPEDLLSALLGAGIGLPDAGLPEDLLAALLGAAWLGEDSADVTGVIRGTFPSADRFAVTRSRRRRDGCDRRDAEPRPEPDATEAGPTERAWCSCEIASLRPEAAACGEERRVLAGRCRAGAIVDPPRPNARPWPWTASLKTRLLASTSRVWPAARDIGRPLGLSAATLASTP
jgi:hypothetical protein